MEVKGTLQIDRDRGVIYFHPSEGPLMGGTLLRLKVDRSKDVDGNALIDVYDAAYERRVDEEVANAGGGTDEEVTKA